MHDPKVVAWEIALPIPVRGWKHRDAKPGEYRWGTRRRRRTNPENLGEPVFPWYRPHGWDAFRVAGRSLALMRVGTIWHNEPDGKDSLTVCKRHTAWKWHVHHWSVQWFLEQKVRRFLFERCRECGRRYPWGYAPVSHSWGEPRSRWWHVEPRSYHHECSSLVSLRQTLATREKIIRSLVDLLRIAGQDEADVVQWLTSHQGPLEDFQERYQLEHLLGYERDGSYRLVKKEAK